MISLCFTGSLPQNDGPFRIFSDRNKRISTYKTNCCVPTRLDKVRFWLCKSRGIRRLLFHIPHGYSHSAYKARNAPHITDFYASCDHLMVRKIAVKGSSTDNVLRGNPCSIHQCLTFLSRVIKIDPKFLRLLRIILFTNVLILLKTSIRRSVNSKVTRQQNILLQTILIVSIWFRSRGRM